RPEFFGLDGRDKLKGLPERLRGTDELHTTWEFFTPWFRDAQRHALGLEWNDWFWVLYGGAGTIGYDRAVFREVGEYIPDLGVGFETGFRFRSHQVFLSAIVAHALHDLGGLEAHVSVKSSR